MYRGIEHSIIIAVRDVVFPLPDVSIGSRRRLKPAPALKPSLLRRLPESAKPTWIGVACEFIRRRLRFKRLAIAITVLIVKSIDHNILKPKNRMARGLCDKSIQVSI